MVTMSGPIIVRHITADSLPCMLVSCPDPREGLPTVASQTLIGLIKVTVGRIPILINGMNLR